MAALGGTIKRLVSDKGFGFILASDGVSISSITPHAAASPSTSFIRIEAVTFEKARPGPKGPRGENVRLA